MAAKKDSPRVVSLVVGEQYYFQTARFDYVGRVLSIDGPYTVTLEDAACVFSTGRLHVFLREGRAPQMELEPVGVQGVQWLGWSPFPHPLFPEAV
jgi:hypothetical protein